MTDEELIAANSKLLVHGDDTEVECLEHGVAVRFGDLSSIGQLAVLAGLDSTDRCLLLETSNQDGKDT